MGLNCAWNMRFLVKSDKAGLKKVESKFEEWQKQARKLNRLGKGKFSTDFCCSHVIRLCLSKSLNIQV